MKKLLLDIETAPNLVHVWALWQQNVGLNQIQDAGYVLCWAAKWHGEDAMYFDSVHRNDPRAMLENIHAMISEADMVIHYNGKSFDMPTLNKEFIVHGMMPPPPYKQVDLCQIAKSTFRFPSNKMDYIAQKLKLSRKRDHGKGHQLWTDCMAGKPEAWHIMEEYNIQDVVVLEEMYDKFLPWIRVHPNHGLYDKPNRPVCPSCGSKRLQARGYARTMVSEYQRFQCKDCGGWCKSGINLMAQSVRKNVLRAVT